MATNVDQAIKDEEKNQDSKETATEDPTSERTGKYKINKARLAILIAGIVITVTILVFLILVFSTKTPKFRVRSVSVENLNYSSNAQNPWFDMTFMAEMSVKNQNFGFFKYGITNVSLAYMGKQVGQVLVPSATVAGLRTKTIHTRIELNSENVTSDVNLGRDLASGFLTLTAQSRMKGKVYVASSGKTRKVNSRKRSASMSCTFTLNLAKKMVQGIKC